MGRSRIRESRLQVFCQEYFIQQGYLTRLEVPFLFKMVDIV